MTNRVISGSLHDNRDIYPQLFSPKYKRVHEQTYSHETKLLRGRP